MEPLIFGTANLVTAAIFVVLSALPFFILYRVGALLGNGTRYGVLRWLLPLGAVALVSVWVYFSFSAYETACKSVQGFTAVSTPRRVPIGIHVLPMKNAHVGGLEYNTSGVLESGVFQFLDEPGSRRCIGPKVREDVLVHPIRFDCDPSLRPGLVVDLLPHRKSAHWWSPPIHEAVMEIRDAHDDRVLARGTDLIFGGGLVGTFLRLLGGDQDFERLSCGFASPDIGPWRPSMTSRPRFAQYLQADLKLLRVAAGK